MNKRGDFDRRFYNPLRWIAAWFCFLVKHEKARWLIKTKRFWSSICITHHSSPTTHHPSPITHHPPPIIHHPSPITHHPPPIIHHPSSITPPISLWCYSNPIVATRINVFGNTRLFKRILPLVATRNISTFLLIILAIHSPVCGYAH